MEEYKEKKVGLFRENMKKNGKRWKGKLKDESRIEMERWEYGRIRNEEEKINHILVLRWRDERRLENQRKNLFFEDERIKMKNLSFEISW